uniref:Putative PD-(D/E)XK nuclease superfamily protein n=1 Tax=viral metagenome TaxID=1070528 RepID=A0A6M3IJY7_9ZZZZ
MNAYSHTSLASFEACPKQFLFRKQKLPAEQPRPLVVGIAGHEALAQYVGTCAASGVASDATIIDGIVDRLDGRDAQMTESIREEVRTLLNGFARNYMVEPDVSPQLEVSLSFDQEWNLCAWNDWSRVRFRGRLDMVKNLGHRVLIRDWKTGWLVTPTSEANEDGQLSRYAFLASLAYPKANEFLLCINYVRWGWEDRFTMTRPEVAHVRESLERAMDRIDREVRFDATPGPACEGCLWRISCPEYRASGRAQTIPENSSALAAEHYLLKARAADVEEALKARLAVEGEILLPGGRVLAYHGQERWKIDDVEGACGDLLESGVDARTLYDQLTLSKTGIDQALKKANVDDRGAIVEAILKARGSVSTSNVMRATKRKGN